MIFEFDQQPQFMQQIQVDDLGNFALRCHNTKDREYYVLVKTYLGKTIILKFGPVYGDLGALIDNMELSFKKLDYKENTIEREVDKYINDGRNFINHIELISENDVLAALPSAETILNSL